MILELVIIHVGIGGGGASTFHPSPDGRSVVGGSRLIKKHAVGQILIQVSAFHVLGDHAERIVADTHPQETDDVGVLQAGQDLHLFQEVVSAGREERTLGLFYNKHWEKGVSQGSSCV